MASIPEMSHSSGKSSVNDGCSPTPPSDPSSKSTRDKEGDMVMDVQEGHRNPRSLGYLHNFSVLIASSDIKPVDLNDPDVDNLWFGSGQIGNKAPSSVLSGTKTAPTEEVSGCRNNPPHGALAETAERSESGTANHFLCPPIKVERDLVMDNNLCEFVALEKVKVEADELVDVARAGTSANSFTPNTKEPTEGGLHTRKGSEIMVLDAQSEEVHTRIKTVPDDARNSVQDSTVNGGGDTVKKRGLPKKQTNNAEVPTSKIPKVSSTSIDNSIVLDMDSTLEDGGKTVRKRVRQRKQANCKSDTNPLSSMIMERRKSSRTPKPKNYSYDIEIDVDGDGRGEEDSEEEWTMPQELMKSPVQITVPYKNKTPRKAEMISDDTATEKEMNQVFCKDCNAAFASLSELKKHELI